MKLLDGHIEALPFIRSCLVGVIEHFDQSCSLSGVIRVLELSHRQLQSLAFNHRSFDGFQAEIKLVRSSRELVYCSVLYPYSKSL